MKLSKASLTRFLTGLLVPYIIAIGLTHYLGFFANKDEASLVDFQIVGVIIFFWFTAAIIIAVLKGVGSSLWEIRKVDYLVLFSNEKLANGSIKRTPIYATKGRCALVRREDFNVIKFLLQLETAHLGYTIEGGYVKIRPAFDLESGFLVRPI
jgi:hypothetical protein